MSMKIVSAAALVASVLAGPALAEATYFGTASNVTVSRQQDNAQAGPASAQRAARTTDGFEARQTFGAPNYGASSDAARENNADAYLGTAWRYQDTADHVTR